MKSSKHILLKGICLVIVFLAMSYTTDLYAQSPPGGATDTQDAIPLDGGLIALVIGAAVFGIKKLRDTIGK